MNVLYISETRLPHAWTAAAQRADWHLLHERDVMSALGAYVTTLPQVIVLHGAVGSMAYAHLRDILPDSPYPFTVTVRVGEQGAADVHLPYDADSPTIRAALNAAITCC